jgi:hypothetical protein
MGGGSASLVPFGHRTLVDAITDRVGPGTSTDAAVTFEAGVRIDRLTPVALRRQLVQPNGEPGLHIEYINGRDWTGAHTTPYNAHATSTNGRIERRTHTQHTRTNQPRVVPPRPLLVPQKAVFEMNVCR